MGLEPTTSWSLLPKFAVLDFLKAVVFYPGALPAELFPHKCSHKDSNLDCTGRSRMFSPLNYRNSLVRSYQLLTSSVCLAAIRWVVSFRVKLPIGFLHRACKPRNQLHSRVCSYPLHQPQSSLNNTFSRTRTYDTGVRSAVLYSTEL